MKSRSKSASEFQKILVASDLHGCYLDKRAYRVFLAVAASTKWDLVVLNGDVADFSQISSHEAKIRSNGHEFFDVPTLEEELEFIKQEIFAPLRKAVGPKTRILMRKGNHEDRWDNISETNATALSELLKTFRRNKSLYLADVLCLDKYKIELSEKAEDTFGGCFTFIHGDSLSKTAAKNNLMRYGSGTSGHTHKMTMFTDVVYGKRHGWWESGCLRTTKNVEYLPFGKRTDWSHGFLELHVREGEFHCLPHFIVNYTTVFRGQTFSA